MSIFDIFAPKPAAAPASADASQQQGQQQNNNQQQGAQPADQNQQQNNQQQGTQTTQQQGTEAPLDAFKDLWQTPVKSGENNDQTMFGEVDPAKIFEAAKKANFSSVVTQEQLSAIEQGGEAAKKAFAQSLNAVAQAVFAQNTLASTKLIETAIAKATARMEASLPAHIKQHSVQDSLLADNPSLSHPAAAPIINALQSQLAVKYPNASTAELKKMAQDYLTLFTNVASPAKGDGTQTKQGQNNQSSGNDVDWLAYVSDGLSQ